MLSKTALKVNIDYVKTDITKLKARKLTSFTVMCKNEMLKRTKRGQFEK